jgi:cbb3-type cytochrome oxidase subunit 3
MIALAVLISLLFFGLVASLLRPQRDEAREFLEGDDY